MSFKQATDRIDSLYLNQIDASAVVLPSGGTKSSKNYASAVVLLCCGVATLYIGMFPFFNRVRMGMPVLPLFSLEEGTHH